MWAADLVDGCVVVWIDRCDPEYAAALANGTFAIPEEWDGYPVCPVWTCGEVIEDEAGFGDLGSSTFGLKTILSLGVAAALGGAIGYVLGGNRGALIGAVASPAGYLGASLTSTST